MVGQLCAFWGFDPGALIPDDDVLAMNLRAALVAAGPGEEQPMESEDEAVARKHWEGMARARKYGDMLRQSYG
jgi:hypothetical protein